MQKMRSFPKEKGLENGLKVLREGYMYAPNRHKIYQSDVFETRLLGEKAMIIGGEEAAKLFYDESKFKREGAAPEPAISTLLGRGGVQQIDDDAHRNRKGMFLDLLASPDRVETWGKIIEKHLLIATKEWMKQKEITFYHESQKVLTRAVCEFAGVPLLEKDVEKRTKQLVGMFESPMAISHRHIQGRMARYQGNKWGESLIEQVRKGQLKPPRHTALYKIAWHENEKGERLETEVAAVELMNVLRPTVALSIYFAFVALSLHHFPEEKEKLNGPNPYYLHMFTQEIRRYYPFFPFNGAEVRHDFDWNGYHFEEGTLVVLDFYGTNHDSRIWEDPEAFIPERFEMWHQSPTDTVQFKLLAQGGGDYATGHRCPGEWNTIKAMEVVTDFLLNKISYEVPEQDLAYSLVKVPTMPKSGFVMKNVEYIG